MSTASQRFRIFTLVVKGIEALLSGDDPFLERLKLMLIMGEKLSLPCAQVNVQPLTLIFVISITGVESMDRFVQDRVLVCPPDTTCIPL